MSINSASTLTLPARELYFSGLKRVIDQIPDRFSTMPADQWIGWLDANAPKLGARKEEIDCCRIKGYLLEAGKVRLHKGDLCFHVERHGVKLEEVVMTGGSERLYDAAAHAVNVAMRLRSPEEEVNRLRVIRDDLRDCLDEAGETRFGEYLVPGGTNYREILISLANDYRQEDVASARAYLKALTLTEPADHSDEYAIETATNNHWTPTSGYRTGHWSAPDILVHLRLDDRIDAHGKKTLFVQEIQSDWAQTGKRNGFQGDGPDISEAQQQAIRAFYAIESLKPIHAGHEVDNVSEMISQIGTLSTRLALSNAGLDPLAADDLHPSRFLVPKGPFMSDTKSWVGLALKRICVMAVDEGYERVQLISGKQACTLYELDDVGQGMRVFYDQLVPQVMRDVLKHLGTSTSTSNKLGGSSGFNVTPEMCQALAAGAPLFGLDPLVGLPNTVRKAQGAKALEVVNILTTRLHGSQFRSNSRNPS